MKRSPYLLIKDFELAVNGKLAPIDLYSIDRQERKSIVTLKNELIDTRLDIQAYELSETREEQLRYAKESRERLARLQQLILQLSNQGVFSAIDVAELGAVIEYISGRLE